MISTTGRSPVIAAPTAAPTKPISEIGVSITRSGPELADQAAGGAQRPAPGVDEPEVGAAGGAGDVLAHAR